MKTINLTEDQLVIVMHALQTEVANISNDITDIQLEILDREDKSVTDEEVERLEGLKARQAAIGKIVNILHNA